MEYHTEQSVPLKCLKERNLSKSGSLCPFPWLTDVVVLGGPPKAIGHHHGGCPPPALQPSRQENHVTTVTFLGADLIEHCVL